MFKAASRQKIRFSHKGNISAEELWDLPLTDLNKIYTSLSSTLSSKQVDSLMTKATKEDDLVNLQMAVVKDVFETISVEREAAKNTKEKKEKKEKLLTILAAKQDSALENKSEAEITAMINEL